MFDSKVKANPSLAGDDRVGLSDVRAFHGQYLVEWTEDHALRDGTNTLEYRARRKRSVKTCG